MHGEPTAGNAGQNGSDPLRPFGMTWPGVVEQRGWVARNYDIHLLTLPQVTPHLRVEGTWPGPISFSSGWFRARARPWNESIIEPMLRLDRGGSDFLASVTGSLSELTRGVVFSPALYPGSTKVWRRSGFEDYASLEVMERSLAVSMPSGPREVVGEDEPPWDGVLKVDRLAFEGFWGMSLLGLQDAYTTNRSTALLTTSIDGATVGYSIVGAQWGVAYLHRIAVRPDHEGSGFGRSLLAGAVTWSRAMGARSMILNVRDENHRARALYQRAGFVGSGTALEVLRHPGRRLLN